MKKNSGPLQYAALVRKIVKSKYSWLLRRGYDMDDLVQEGLLAIFNASHNYDPQRCSEVNFYAVCIERRMLYLADLLDAQRRTPHNMLVSLDAGADSGDDQDTGQLRDTLCDERASAEIDALIDRISPSAEPTQVQRIMAYLQSVDPQAEAVVRAHYLDGMSWSQIADVNGKCPGQLGRLAARGIRLIREHFNINIGGQHETE